jgi:hypothetical protein
MRGAKAMSEIKVVPCRECLAINKHQFCVQVGNSLVMGEIGAWCGTEAEALAKKAELEAIENFVAETTEPFDINASSGHCASCDGENCTCSHHAPAAIEQARPQTPEVCRYCLETRIPIDVRLTLERERTKVCAPVPYQSSQISKTRSR